MKIAGLILFCLAAVAAPAQTYHNPCCRFHLRGFGTTAVDLSPLFQWWERQPSSTNGGFTTAVIDPDTNNAAKSDRPLTAWHRIAGFHAGNVIGGNWVVDAYIYTSPTCRTNTRLILNHPPTGEERNYYTFKQELTEDTQQITNDARAYQNNVKAEEKAERHSQQYNRSNKAGKVGANGYAAQAQQDQQAAGAAATDQQQVTADRTQIEQQFKAIPAVNGIYRLDWFAVMRGRSKEGLPIYDLGVVSATLP